MHIRIAGDVSLIGGLTGEMRQVGAGISSMNIIHHIGTYTQSIDDGITTVLFLILLTPQR